MRSRMRSTGSTVTGGTRSRRGGQVTDVPSTTAGMTPIRLSTWSDPLRHRSVTSSVSTGGCDRTLPGGSGHASPSITQPSADGPNGSYRKVKNTDVAGAAGRHTVPHVSVIMSSRKSLRTSAFGVGSGTQLRRPSCAADAASPAFCGHHTAGVAPSSSSPISSTFLSVYWNTSSPRCTHPSAGAPVEPGVTVAFAPRNQYSAAVLSAASTSIGGIASIASGMASIGTRRWFIGTSGAGCPIGTGGGGGGGGGGIVSPKIPSAMPPSIGLSTPVPIASAGERLTSRSDWNRSGAATVGVLDAPSANSTQPSTEKNRNSTFQQISPSMRDTFVLSGSSPTSTVRFAHALMSRMNRCSVPRMYSIPASTNGSNPSTASNPPATSAYRPTLLLPHTIETCSPVLIANPATGTGRCDAMCPPAQPRPARSRRPQTSTTSNT